MKYSQKLRFKYSLEANLGDEKILSSCSSREIQTGGSRVGRYRKGNVSKEQETFLPKQKRTQRKIRIKKAQLSMGVLFSY